jgi:hypothetical protein
LAEQIHHLSKGGPEVRGLSFSIWHQTSLFGFRQTGSGLLGDGLERHGDLGLGVHDAESEAAGEDVEQGLAADLAAPAEGQLGPA